MATNGLDVEHFRPKGKAKSDPTQSGYWWLAYDPSNYLLGCTVCNQKRKSTSFRLEPGALRTTWETRANIGNERRILLDPSEDAIEGLFELEWDDLNCRLLPHSGLSPPESGRVQAVIDFFGLNLDPEIRKQRLRVHDEAIQAAHEHDWNRLRRMAMAHNEHSFVAWFVLREKAP
jgi:hypothetical protein